LIFTATSRGLLVFNALQPLLGDEERALYNDFTFIITALELEEIKLEKTLKAAPHIPVWLVPKNEVDVFKSRWVEGLYLIAYQPARRFHEIQPVAPEVNTVDNDSLFDNDSVGDEYTPVVSMESRASDPRGTSP
jgi:hypothetical protein